MRDHYIRGDWKLSDFLNSSTPGRGSVSWEDVREGDEEALVARLLSEMGEVQGLDIRFQ